MARTTRYVIYLGGSTNAYNNGPGPVGIETGTGHTARDRELDAIEHFQLDGVPVYRDQYLYARPAAHCSAADRGAAWSDEEVRAWQHTQTMLILSEDNA